MNHFLEYREKIRRQVPLHSMNPGRESNPLSIQFCCREWLLSWWGEGLRLPTIGDIWTQVWELFFVTDPNWGRMNPVPQFYSRPSVALLLLNAGFAGKETLSRDHGLEKLFEFFMDVLKQR